MATLAGPLLDGPHSAAPSPAWRGLSGGDFNDGRASRHPTAAATAAAAGLVSPAAGKSTTAVSRHWNWRNFVVAALVAPLFTTLELLVSDDASPPVAGRPPGNSGFDADQQNGMHTKVHGHASKPGPATMPYLATAHVEALARHGERLMAAIHSGNVAASLQSVKKIMEAMPSAYVSGTSGPPELPTSDHPDRILLSLTPWSVSSVRRFHSHHNSSAIIAGAHILGPRTPESAAPANQDWDSELVARLLKDPVAKMRVVRRCSKCQALFMQYELNQLLLQKLKQLMLQSKLSSCSPLVLSGTEEVEALLCPELAAGGGAAAASAAASVSSMVGITSQHHDRAAGGQAARSRRVQWGKLGFEVPLRQPASVSPDAWVLAHLRRVVQRLAAESEAAGPAGRGHGGRSKLEGASGRSTLLASATAWLERRQRAREVSMGVLCRIAPSAVEWPAVAVDPLWAPTMSPSEILASLAPRQPYTMLGQKELVMAPLPGLQAGSGVGIGLDKQQEGGSHYGLEDAGPSADARSPRLRKLAVQALSEWRRDPDLYPPADGRAPLLVTFAQQYFHQPECVPTNVRNLYNCALNRTTFGSGNDSRSDGERHGRGGGGSMEGARAGKRSVTEEVTQWGVELGAGFEVRVNVDEPSGAHMWRLAWEIATLAGPAADAESGLKQLEEYAKFSRTRKRRRLGQDQEQPEQQQEQKLRRRKERAPRHSNVLYIIFGHNTHEMHGFNRNAKAARGRLVTLLQDDEIVPRNCGWFDRIVALFYKHSTWLGGVGYRTGRVFCDGPNWPELYSLYRRAFLRSEQPYGDPSTGLRGYAAGVVDFTPYAMPRMLWHSMGGLDESWTRRGWTGIMVDWQFTFRVWFTGFELYHLATIDRAFHVFSGPQQGGTHTLGKGMATRHIHGTVNFGLLLKYYFGPFSPFTLQGLQITNSLMTTLDVWM